MERGLSTTSTSSLRTLEWMLSRPIELYKFNLMRWSLTFLLLQREGFSFPYPHLEVQGHERHEEPVWQ